MSVKLKEDASWLRSIKHEKKIKIKYYVIPRLVQGALYKNVRVRIWLRRGMIGWYKPLLKTSNTTPLLKDIQSSPYQRYSFSTAVRMTPQSIYSLPTAKQRLKGNNAHFFKLDFFSLPICGVILMCKLLIFTHFTHGLLVTDNILLFPPIRIKKLV